MDKNKQTPVSHDCLTNSNCEYFSQSVDDIWNTTQQQTEKAQEDPSYRNPLQEHFVKKELLLEPAVDRIPKQYIFNKNSIFFNTIVYSLYTIQMSSENTIVWRSQRRSKHQRVRIFTTGPKQIQEQGYFLKTLISGFQNCLVTITQYYTLNAWVLSWQQKES